MDLNEKEVVNFTKMDGGIIVTTSGTLSEVLKDFVIVSVGTGVWEQKVKFRRAPGSKSGFGMGDAKFWRLCAEERSKYVHPDLPRRR